MLTGLRWDPDDFGGVEQIQASAAGGPGTRDVDIWLPDVQPYFSGNLLSAELERSRCLLWRDLSLGPDELRQASEKVRGMAW